MAPQFFSPVTFELAARSSQLAARSRCRVTSVANHESIQQALTMSFAHSQHHAAMSLPAHHTQMSAPAHLCGMSVPVCHSGRKS